MSGIVVAVLFSMKTVPTIAVAQTWEWLNPLPQGDPIRKIFFVDEQYGWMALASNNLLQTTDGGISWEVVPVGFQAHSIFFINRDVGWSTGARDGFSNDVGLYRTTNGGHEWTNVLPDTFHVADPRESYVHFVDSDVGWFAVRDPFALEGILKTTDGGDTWVVQARDDLFDVVQRGVLGMAFRDSLHGIVGSTRFSIITTNGGTTWRRDTSLLRYSQFFFVDSLHGWGSTSPLTFEPSISHTTDGGLTWKAVVTPRAGKLFPISPSECFLYRDSVYFTADTGATWQLRSPSAFEHLVFTSSEGGWAAEGTGTDADFFQTSDGGKTWTRRDQNKFTAGYSEVNGVEFLNDSIGWITGFSRTEQGSLRGFLAKTSDGGNTWSVSTPTGAGQELHFVNESVGWLITGNTIIKSADGGKTWQAQSSGTSKSLIKSDFLNEQRGWIVGDGIILKTTNGGTTWEEKTFGVPTYLDEIQFVDSLHGWACGISFRSDTYPVYMRTSDGGETWIHLFPDSEFTVNRVSFLNPAHGWGIMTQRESAAFKIVVTSDSGFTWQERYSQSGDTRGGMFSGHIRFLDSSRVFVAGGFGTFLYTTDAGTSWNKETGTFGRWVGDLSVVDTGLLYLVGWNGMLLRRKDSGTTFVERATVPIGPELTLHPVYPNPFNSEVTIVYDLLRAADVSIELYDILGKKLQRWELEKMEAGLHQFRINTHMLPSGLLFVRVTAGTSSLTRKAVLIK